MAAALPCQNERNKGICWGSWLHSGKGRIPKDAQMSWDLQFRWVLSWTWLDRSWHVCLSLQLYCLDSSACSAHTQYDAYSDTLTVSMNGWLQSCVDSKIYRSNHKISPFWDYWETITIFNLKKKNQQFLPYSLFWVVFFTGFFQVRTENPPPFFCRVICHFLTSYSTII